MCRGFCWWIFVQVGYYIIEIAPVDQAIPKYTVDLACILHFILVQHFPLYLLNNKTHSTCQVSKIWMPFLVYHLAQNVEHRSLLDAKKILLDKAMIRAIPKQVTTNPLISTGHCYTGDTLPSVQPSAESVCNPVMLPGSPRTTRLPNSLHPAVWLVTQSLLQPENLCTLSLCLDHLYVPHWELPVESTPRNVRFSTGERGVAQQPLSSSHVKQDVQWLTWKDIQKGTVTQTAASPKTAIILEVSKVTTIINQVQRSHEACRTTAPGSKWVTGI